MGKTGGNRTVRASRDNFWSALRVKSGVTRKELGELLGMKEGYVGMLFTGQRMPTEKTIKTLCEFFDVDILKGTQEFKKAHQEWDAQEAGKRNFISSPPTATHSPETPESETAEQAIPMKRSEIYSKLYSKVSCEEFLKIKELVDRAPDNTNFLEVIYREVSYKTFITVYRTFAKYLQEYDL